MLKKILIAPFVLVAVVALCVVFLGGAKAVYKVLSEEGASRSAKTDSTQSVAGDGSMQTVAEGGSAQAVAWDGSTQTVAEDGSGKSEYGADDFEEDFEVIYAPETPVAVPVEAAEVGFEEESDAPVAVPIEAAEVGFEEESDAPTAVPVEADEIEFEEESDAPTAVPVEADEIEFDEEEDAPTAISGNAEAESGKSEDADFEIIRRRVPVDDWPASLIRA